MMGRENIPQTESEQAAVGIYRILRKIMNQSGLGANLSGTRMASLGGSKFKIKVAGCSLIYENGLEGDFGVMYEHIRVSRRWRLLASVDTTEGTKMSDRCIYRIKAKDSSRLRELLKVCAEITVNGTPISEFADVTT